MPMTSAHVDTFARDNLPATDQQPVYLFDLPGLKFPPQLNCASELLDRHVLAGRGDRTCLRAGGVTWTYSELMAKANQIANVLVRELGLVPGNRVLLRAGNTPLLVACWFAVVKAGGIAVTTMPLLRAKELEAIVRIGKITHALCAFDLADELGRIPPDAGLREIRFFGSTDPQGLDAAMAKQSEDFVNATTLSDDTCLLGFTSGTTGVPKATMHFHRDVLAVCRCWSEHILRPSEDDVFIGTPPLAFTFGLGGLVLMPMDVGASVVLLEKSSPLELFNAIKEYRATIVFTAPTSYRMMASRAGELSQSALRKCVSAGEALPATTRALWKDATGIELIDGIGSTEMLHIFISHDESNAKPGATGVPVPGYRARVVDSNGNEVEPGIVGRLAVQGPTGCRYLNDPRQSQYVQNGWNFTGDAYVMDAEGYFIYQARTDDMIVSSGYNIAAPEVEEALIQHAAVSECAVIGIPDEERGQIVKAFVVLRQGTQPSAETVATLQKFVKETVAPYKYPRAVEFVESLPRTQSGKIQRFHLRDSGRLDSSSSQ